MTKQITRPAGMSQLDYLWLNFAGYEIHNEASEVPQDNVLLTEKALTSILQKSTAGGITTLTFRDHPTKPDTTQLIGTALNGTELTVVEMPKEVHITAFVGRSVSLTDVDKGCPYAVGTKVLVITLSNGVDYMVSLESLNLAIRGSESNSIITEVNDGIVSANIKIDEGNNATSIVRMKVNQQGISSSILLSEEKSGVELTKLTDGLLATIPLGTTGYNLKFDSLTLSEYLNIPYKEPGRVYFITDMPYIFLNEIRYGVNMKPGDVPLVSLVYDPETMVLAYKKADETDIRFISLGPVAVDKNGMMSKEQYAEHLKFKQALDGVVSVKDYVSEQLSTVGIALAWGDIRGTERELLLKNGLGDTLSTILIPTENYLSFAVNKRADFDDVIEAAKLGVLISEGTQILVLTLTSGDKVYTDLSQLVDIYTAANTESISMQISNTNEISADLNISTRDKMLYIYPDGVASHIQIVRTPGKVTFYGRTQTDEDKLGEFEVGDTLIKTAFISKSEDDTFRTYPPRRIDGKDYDPLTNPFLLGVPYFILVYGADTGDTSTSYTYNDYVSINPLVNSLVLSPEEGNMLTRDNNGYLYCANNWINVN